MKKRIYQDINRLFLNQKYKSNIILDLEEEELVWGFNKEEVGMDFIREEDKDLYKEEDFNFREFRKEDFNNDM